MRSGRVVDCSGPVLRFLLQLEEIHTTGGVEEGIDDSDDEQ